MKDKVLESISAAERAIEIGDTEGAKLWILVAKKYRKEAVSDDPMIERRNQPIDTRASARN